MITEEKFYTEKEMETHGWVKSKRTFGACEIWKKDDKVALRNPVSKEAIHIINQKDFN